MKTLSFQFALSGTKITVPFSVVCSVTGKPFGGFVVIEYIPSGKSLEFVDVERAIKRQCKAATTAEEFTHAVFQDAWRSLKPNYLKVLLDVQQSDAHQPVQIWIESPTTE